MGGEEPPRGEGRCGVGAARTVELAHQRPEFGGALELEGRLRPGFRFRDPQLSDLLLGCRDCPWRHAQLVDAQADQDRDGLRVGGNLPAHAGPLAGAVGRVDDDRDLPQDRRMACVIQPGDPAFPRSAATVYCVRSLVPMLTNSTSGSRCSIPSAEAGVSTMMPRMHS
jgi:hypothetical protein